MHTAPATMPAEVAPLSARRLWPLHKAAEVRALGHDFSDYYGWHYPPPFLFVAAALALLPYLTAAVLWLVATLAAYAAAGVTAPPLAPAIGSRP